MDPKELQAYRTKLFRDVTAWKKPDRIPQMSMFQNWQILDSGMKLSEAMSDWDKMEQVVRMHQERYNFDLLVNNGARNPYPVYKALGSERYIIDDVNESINYKDVCYVDADELEEFTQDYWKFVWEKGMPKKYEWWGKETPLDVVQNAINERIKYFGYLMKISGILNNEYGLPVFCPPNPVPPFSIETVFSYIRGIKGMTIDMRRNTEKFDAMIAMLDERFYKPAIEGLKKCPVGANMGTAFDSGTTLLCQNMLNTKQWDKYYWPYFKEYLDVLNEKQYTTSIFPEGALLRFADYLNEYDKGLICLMLELDDPFDVRKFMPNVAINGGMSNVLLNNGTKEECIDLARRLINELGLEGGYMMTQTKIGTFRNDGNPENVKAVSDFVLNYRW